MGCTVISFLTELFAEAVDVEAKDAWTFFKLMDVSGDAATHTHTHTF